MQFVENVEEIRQRARQKIEEGPVTEAYGADRDQAIKILNEALATEIVCVLRYLHHYFMATGVHGKSVASEFKEHADAEREHADEIAERVQQLGGKPDFNPRNLLERSASQYVEGETLADMIREDLVAERIVIEVYTEMIRWFGDKDPTTRVMLEHILKEEEQHANDLADMLFVVDPRSGKTEGQDPGTTPMEFARQAKAAKKPGAEEARGDKVASGNGGQRQAPKSGGAASSGQERQPSREGERNVARNPEQRGDRGGQNLQGDFHNRPPRKQMEMRDTEEPGEVHPGAEQGGSRSVKVTNPSRKRRIA